MNVASHEAIEAAIQLLIRSIHEENVNMVLSENSDSTERLVVEADAMEASFQVLSKAWWDRIVALRRKRNAVVSPVHQLPVETLVTIFRLHAESEVARGGWGGFNSRRYYENLHTVARVARPWSVVVANTPSLWTVITSRTSIEFAKTALRKSGDTLPLTIVALQPGADLDWLPDFQALVQSQSPRWKSVYLSFPEARLFPAFLNVATPSLTTVKLSFKYLTNFYHGEAVNPFPTQLSTLQDVSVDGLSVPWAEVVLSGLVCLEIINGCLGGQKFTPDHVLRLLKENPKLQKFVFWKNNGKNPVTIGWMGGSKEEIVLVDLQELTIRGLSTSMAGIILESLQAPNCRRLYLDCNLYGQSPSFLLPAIEPLLVTSLQSCKPRLLKICVEGTQFQIHAGQEITIKLRGVIGFKALEWIGKVLQKSSPSTLVQLHCWDGVDTSDSTFLPSLRELRGLQDILLDNTIPECLPFIKHISTPAVVDDVLHWPFPHLDTFLLEPQDFRATDMLEMVRSRHGLLHEGEAMELPAPIKYLEYMTDTQSEEEDIEEEIAEILEEEGSLNACQRQPPSDNVTTEPDVDPW